MDGSESYPASKLKAFGFPCGCCLLWVLLFIGAIFMIGALAPELNKLGENNPELRDAAKQYQQMDDDDQEFMNSLEGETTQEDMDEQLERMNELNRQQIEQMNMQMQLQMDSREAQDN